MSRAELLDPLDPRMYQLPEGECTLSRRDGTLWIEHADSRILISLELLDAIVRGEQSPEVSIRVRDDADTSPGCWLGAVIRIEAANRTVLYRITGYAHWCLSYIAEWPD